ncbi:MAG: bifunctional oligoribonuclease/PAP phosphatase NrnA [Desulfomonile sp.]|jgi:nanoRNase/pAp phosphatase (c-di-AMP/oligoRNAs hydrolase)|nr:bifunctional oligoribonuclease/PAP phosphatase NrnA [Deltaproteobacteria bacterium]
MNSFRWDLNRSIAKLLALSDLLESQSDRRILILCHNNPDPDTIAGAYGFSFLLGRKFGIRSSIAYGGVVTRAENKAMIHRLRIPMSPLSVLDPELSLKIALVDGQPGTGNNLLFSRETPPLIVIDHHPLRKLSLKAAFHDVRPNYGSTSTIITEYLVAAGLDPPRTLANALLYGLKTDTNSLVRTASKPDFCAFNYLSPLTNPRVLGWIEKPPLPVHYFEDYYLGLSRTMLYRDVAVSHLGEIKSEAIVPELADLLLRIENVSWSLCMAETGDLMILSLRSTSRKQQAGSVMRRLIGQTGSAGGHREMAGGTIRLTGMSPAESKELPDKLVNKFLTLINRRKLTPKPLVSTIKRNPDAE